MANSRANRQGARDNLSDASKRSEAKKKALEEIYMLVPLATDELRNMLMDFNTPHDVKLECAKLILERVLGKPTTLEQIESNEAHLFTAQTD